MNGVSSVRVAICDEAISYRRGLGTILDAAGYIVEDIDEVRAQPLLSGVSAVLFTVRSASDWEALPEMVTVNPNAKLLVLLVDATADRHAEALRAGAHAVVAWEGTPEMILAVMRAALEGSTLLPTTVAHAIAASGPAPYDPEWITADEVGWLKLLAGGATVQQVAQKAGYSERALYRMLHGLYGRMRVSNRMEAVLQASRWGLLDQG